MRPKDGIEKRKPYGGRAAVLFLAAALFFSGCGARRDEVLTLREPQETGMAPSIAVAPLLTWEDAETQNLAGLLQEQCGGMMAGISAGSLLGSGVLYRVEEGNLVILTAGHVLAEASGTVVVTFADGWEYESDDFICSKQSDLAAVRVPAEQIPQRQSQLYYLANIDKESYDAVKPGDICIVMGSGSGVAEEAYEGRMLEPWIYMEDYGQYMSWVDVDGKPGMSGGGLFDCKGRFLGILSGVSEDGQWAAVPLALILAEF